MNTYPVRGLGMILITILFSFALLIYIGAEFSEYRISERLNDGQNVLCFTPSHHDHSINEMIGIKAELDHLILFNR